jgi:membrane-associated phospholipid phosphatase
MDYRGLSVIGVWIGAVGISTVFLNYHFTTDFVMAMIVFAIILTVYIVRLKPGGEISVEVDKVVQGLAELRDRLSALEKSVDRINKMLED